MIHYVGPKKLSQTVADGVVQDMVQDRIILRKIWQFSPMLAASTHPLCVSTGVLLLACAHENMLREYVDPDVPVTITRRGKIKRPVASQITHRDLKVHNPLRGARRLWS